MIRPSLGCGRGLASSYVTPSLLWWAGIVAVTAPLTAGDLPYAIALQLIAVSRGSRRWRCR